MIPAAQRDAIRRTWELVAPLGTTVADLFYKRLFELAPQYRQYFSEDLEPQKRKLISMLQFIVRAADWPEERWQQSVDTNDDLFLVVLALGRRHSSLYQVPDEAYAVVGEALLWTLDFGLGEAFTHDVREAWTALYTIVSRTMKLGRYAVGEASLLAEGTHG